MTSWFGRSNDTASKQYMSEANVIALIKKNDRKVSSERRKSEKIVAQAEEKIRQFQQVMSRAARAGNSTRKPRSMSTSASSSRSQANLLRKLADSAAAADAQAFVTAYPNKELQRGSSFNPYVNANANANAYNAYANANANARTRELIATSKPKSSDTRRQLQRQVNAFLWR